MILGLENLGNSCYLNCAIQLFCRIREFNNENIDNLEQTPEKVIIKEIFKIKETSELVKRSNLIIKPSSLMSILYIFDPKYKEKGDSHEFINFVLDKFETILPFFTGSMFRMIQCVNCKDNI